MKTITTLAVLGMLTSCGSLTKNVAGVPYKQFTAKDLVGLNPVQMKERFGEPVMEGFNNANIPGPLTNSTKGFFYALVYSEKPTAMYAYNLDKSKNCFIVRFYAEDEFKYEHVWSVKRSSSAYCNLGNLQNYWGITPKPLEEFWAKYGYDEPAEQTVSLNQ